MLLRLSSFSSSRCCYYATSLSNFLSLPLSLCLFLCSNLITFPLFHSLPYPLQILFNGHDSPPHHLLQSPPFLSPPHPMDLIGLCHLGNILTVHSTTHAISLLTFFSASLPRVPPPSLSYSFMFTCCQFGTVSF